MDSTERSRPVGRRKACDVCHLRKIKCDAKKPNCSHCVLYQTKCTFTPQLQKRPKKDKKRESAPKEYVGLSDRLAKVEARLRQNRQNASDRVEADKPGSDVDNLNALSSEKENLVGVGDDMWACLTINLTLDDIKPVETNSLPPLQEVLPLVECYFANVNCAMPLFSESEFKKMLLEWYADPSTRTTNRGAAINVVMALSLWHNPSRQLCDTTAFMRQCIRNAQSIIPGLHLQEFEFLDLQIVLGLVMLFQAGPNPRPAAVLIATAVKIAHRLRLHTKRHWEILGGSGAAQRDRVFWIIYVMERDFSMRLREPYIMQDYDMDVDLPEFTTMEDNAGIVIANDGHTWLNFLLCRIDMARIQAKVYELMYSVRGEKLSEAGQAAAVQEHLDLMLADWKESIPLQFQPDMLASSGDELGGSARYLAMLHFLYYTCVYQVHGVYSHDSVWIRKLTTYSERYANGYDVRPGPHNAASLLPPTFQEDLETSRECMRLFRVVNPKDLALMGTTSCTYIAGLLILLANKLTSRDQSLNSHLESDDILIDEGLSYVDRMSRMIHDERLRKLYLGCCELNSRATTACLSIGGLMQSPTPKSIAWPTLADFYGAFALGDIEAERAEHSSLKGNPSSQAWPSDVANLISLVDLDVLGG